MFAHPALDHRGDRLHGGFDVDLAGGVARGFQRLADFRAKPSPERVVPGHERE
jgi:hypothetical protein